MKTSRIGPFSCLTFDCVDSTSTLLREGDFPHYTVVRALSQTAGRGRRGNPFISPAGGLYFSVKLPRPMVDSEMWAVTFMAANALCDAIGGRAAIKWVNDIYIDGGKVAGILTEVRADALIVGVGVNVKSVAMPDEIAQSATSLERAGIDITAEELLYCFFEHFDNAFVGWNIPLTLEKYRKRSLLTGKEIRYTENGVKKYATALGIGDNGNLICQRDGKTFALSSGEVFAVRSTGAPSAQ